MTALCNQPEAIASDLSDDQSRYLYYIPTLRMGSGSVRIGPTPVSWPKVVKGVPNQGVDCSVIRAVFSVSLLCLGVYVVFCFFVFGCQYQRN